MICQEQCGKEQQHMYQTKVGTLEEGWNYSSWTSDYSYFPALDGQFFTRGGELWNVSHIDVCAYDRGSGGSNCHNGFRAVLVR